MSPTNDFSVDTLTTYLSDLENKNLDLIVLVAVFYILQTVPPYFPSFDLGSHPLGSAARPVGHEYESLI